MAIYRAGDEPADRLGSFQVAPAVIIEILSDDADHDLVRKDAIYAELGVSQRAYIDMQARWDWWCRVDGLEHGAETVTWRLDGWPAVVLDADHILGA